MDTMKLSISEAAKMAEEIHYELIAKEEAAREREAQGWNVVEPAYPAFDTPQPSEAERIAALEAKVEALEAALAKVPPREYGGWQTVAELYDFEPGASSGELVLREKKK